jgi:hypothetical protein
MRMSLAVVFAGCLLSACVIEDGAVSLPMNAGIDVTLSPVSSFGAAGSPGMIGGASSLRLGYAAAVAATGNVIYVVDAAAPGLVRLDEASGEVRLLYELRDANTAGLHVSMDIIIQVVDRYNRAVIEIDQSGWERRRFSDSRLIPAPVDVTHTNWGSTILIADELSQRLAMFDSMSNPTGLFTTTLSPVAAAASIKAIAATANYVFVLATEKMHCSRRLRSLSMSASAYSSQMDIRTVCSLRRPSSTEVTRGRLFRQKLRLL